MARNRYKAARGSVRFNVKKALDRVERDLEGASHSRACFAKGGLSFAMEMAASWGFKDLFGRAKKLMSKAQRRCKPLPPGWVGREKTIPEII